METETIHINDSWRSSYAAHDHDLNVLTYMQIFKACPFSVNHGIWQASNKAQARTSSHKQQGTWTQALKSFEDLHSVHDAWNNTRKLFAQSSLQWLEQKNTKAHIVPGAECISGAFLWEILPSLVGFGAPLPHAQHISEFDIFCEILAHQNISSSRTDQKTPRNPRSMACIHPNAPWPQAWVLETDG